MTQNTYQDHTLELFNSAAFAASPVQSAEASGQGAIFIHCATCGFTSPKARDFPELYLASIPEEVQCVQCFDIERYEYVLSALADRQENERVGG